MIVKLKYFLSLLAFVPLLTIAQSDYLTADEMPLMSEMVDLNGKGSIVFESFSADLVITSSLKTDPKPQAVLMGNKYRYEFLLDIEGGSRNFIVRKRGSSANAEVKKIPRSNQRFFFEVTEIQNPITYELQPSRGDSYFKDRKASIRITSPLKGLKVQYSPRLAIKLERADEDDVEVIALEIDIDSLEMYKKRSGDVNEQYNAVNAIINEKQETDLSSITDEEWDLQAKLEGELNKVNAELNEAISIRLSGENTNVLSLPSDDILGLSNKAMLPYGILLMKQEVYKTICSTFKEEGNRSFSRRDYDEAIRYYNMALEADDATPEMALAIKNNLTQCDSCKLYERYAMTAIGKFNELRRAGTATQEEVVRYAGGAIEYLQTLNEYNPNDFYEERIGILENVIESLPLDIMFTIAKWVNDKAGFYEDGVLANVEVWTFAGEQVPDPSLYKNDKKFRELVGKSSLYSQLASSDSEGIVELHLDRKSLPKGFFFRPVGYGDKVRIEYLDANDVLRQSEGTYNQRRLRMRMYVSK